MKKKFYIIKKQNPREILAMAIGVFLGIGGIALLSHLTGNVFIMAPFGASAVLLYCAKSSPLAQPRNFLASHFIAATIGITCVRLFGSEWYVTAISVSLAILAMMLTDTVHPPGGATALLVVLQGTTDYRFLISPIAIGVAIMFIAALVAGRISGATQYPAGLSVKGSDMEEINTKIPDALQADPRKQKHMFDLCEVQK